MPIAAAIAGSAVIGGVSSYLSAKEQRKGLNSASNTQKDMFNKLMSSYEPFRKIGLGAYSDLYKMLSGPIQSSPLYQWRAKEGTKNINTQLAARGLYNSGAGIKTLQDFYTNLSAQEENTRLNRLQGVAGIGVNALNNMSAGMNTISGRLSTIAAQKGQVGGQMYQNFNDVAQSSLGMYGAGKGWWNLR